MKGDIVLVVGSFFFILCVGAEHQKKHCSKFDYEMRSLEAMLRTEHKVEKMLEEMKALKEATLKDLDDSKVFQEVIKTEMDDLRSETNRWLIEKDKLETATRNTNEKLQAFETSSQLLMDRIEAFVNGSAVAFSVAAPTKSLVDDVPTFTKIITNIGGGYNIDTGVFTSPVSGIYMFTLTVASDGAHDVYCWIKHNSDSTVFSRSFSDNGFTSASTSVILFVAKHARVYPGSCMRWNNYVYDKATTGFSGVLLKQTSIG